MKEHRIYKQFKKNVETAALSLDGINLLSKDGVKQITKDCDSKGDIFINNMKRLLVREIELENRLQEADYIVTKLKADYPKVDVTLDEQQDESVFIIWPNGKPKVKDIPNG